MKNLTLAVLVILLVPSLCFAMPVAPEIDISTAPAAFALLGGALLVLRGRRKR
jgi:hypothetical protein